MPLKVDSVISSSVSTQTILVNGVDTCKTTAPIYDVYPFQIFPTLTETCTTIVNSVTTEGAPNLKGYKVSTIVQLECDTSYGEYFGTLRIIGGATGLVIGPTLKTIGNVRWFSSDAPIFTTEPLGLINRGWDTGGSPVYIETELTSFYGNDGDDLLIDLVLFVNKSSLGAISMGNLEVTISIETEFTVFEGQSVTLEYIAP